MKNIVFLGVFMFLFIGCNNDDDNVRAKNEPPISFDLIDVPNNAAEVDILPLFSWESAKNPKGGYITYDLYIDQNPDPITLVKSNIDKTSFQLDQSLDHLSTYYWKVVANDMDGQRSQSSIQHFTTRNHTFSETPVTDEAAFSKKFSHAVTVFDDKIWITGGGSDVVKNDIWYSSNGSDWVEVVPITSFPERYSHQMLTFDNKLWVIGGRQNSGALNDVWYSTDGLNWIESTAIIGIHNHSAVVFNDKIWVIAGTDSSFEPTNLIRFSEDGSTWKMQIGMPEFSKRTGQACVVFKDKLWLIGGFGDGERKNDVWSSEDGLHWVNVTENAAFSPRNSHQTVVFDDKIWVIGGVGEGSFGSEELGDVWYSEDGVAWQPLQVPEQFPEIAQFASVVFKDRMWIIGGVTNNHEGDEVWASH